jgi:hypothetical protein
MDLGFCRLTSNSITFFIDINVIVAGLICMCGSAISVRLPITVRSPIDFKFNQRSLKLDL